MFIKETYLPCSNLQASLDFYSHVLLDHVQFRGLGFISLQSGIVLCSESYWTEHFGIEKKDRGNAIASINVILETTGYDNFLRHVLSIQDRVGFLYKENAVVDGRRQMVFLDPDMHLITIVESIYHTATLSDMEMEGKESGNYVSKMQLEGENRP